MNRNRWVCIVKLGQHGLRRGTWYPILNDNGADVVIDVRGTPLAVARDAVSLHVERPLKWTVIHRSPDEPPDPDGGSSPYYAVCPNCLYRTTTFTPGTEEFKCPRCRLSFEVDWSGELDVQPEA